MGGAEREMFEFLLELFGPFVDSLWLSATTLLSLENKRLGVMERMMVERAQWFGEKSFFEKMMAYFDATLKVFIRAGMLEVDDSTCITLSPSLEADGKILRA